MPSIKFDTQGKPRALPAWVVVLIFIVGIALGFGAFWLLLSVKPQPPAVPPAITRNPSTPQVAGQPPTTTVLEAVTSTQSAVTSTSDQEMPSRNLYSDYPISPLTDTESLAITWSTPKHRNPKDVWRPVLTANQDAGIYDNATYDGLSASLTVLENSYAPAADSQALGTWELGQVSSGKYVGYTLFEQRDGACDLGGCTDFRFIVSPDGKRAISIGPLNVDQMKSFREQPTSIQSGPGYVAWEKIVTPDFDLSLKDASQSITSVKVNGKSVYAGQAGSWDTTYMDWLRTGGKMTGYIDLGKTDDGWTVYSKQDQGCGYVQAPDKTFLPVASKIAVKNPEGYEDADRAMDIQWDTQALDGKQPAKLYMATGGGCDSFCPIKAEAGEDVSPDALIMIGKVNGNEPIFLPKDMAKSPTVKMAYDNWFLPDGKAKPSFDDFLKSKPVPIFLWQDAFGRWMRYADAELSPPAECGKPVIYLYPTKATDVRVKLPPTIDVTVSDPTYPVHGWQTIARPDGTLTMADGQRYGSLYWEGTGVSYAPPHQGFVIKDGEQASFLKSTLTNYGLNDKEAGEFMDFWLPQMTGAPYYRVSFLTDVWSAAAPLYVTPQPETSIRIFMDWQKLSAPISITPPKIVTPQRLGFTLVEWGGLLYEN